MKKNFGVLLALFVGLISQLKLNAQASFAELENNKIIYPSPTAAGLGKYGEYPVSLYNGSVNIGQDIVTVKSGHLSLNISLSYNASGNKPSDIPGWVGLGFSLNAGGVITRIIRDLPDDLIGGFYASNTSVQYLWNNYPNSDFIGQYFDGTNDPRSDVYQFNFCGKTGEFVFDWDKNIHFKQKVPFKIEVLGGPGGFGGFAVTTDDGTIYTFDLAEHTQVSALSVNAPISSWYLTKIKNLSGDSIVLKYTEPTGKYRYKQYSTRKEVNGSISGADLVTSPTINLNTTTDEVVYLDEIDFTNGKLGFGKSKREDPYFVPAGIDPSYAEEKKLDFIALKDNNNNLVKQWKFEYFENSTERLKLKDLITQASDQTDVQKYSFEYNFLKLPLPPSGPNPSNPYLSNDVDYWGYYNAAGNGDNRIPQMYVSEFNQYVGSANRTINPAVVQAEMLQKITYPTGGYTSFEYEPNDYSAQGASYAAAQNPMIVPTPLTESYELHYARDDGGFDIDPTTTSFTLTETTHVHISYNCGADGPNHEWANPGETYEFDYQSPAGTYTLSSLFRTDVLLASGSADITRANCYATVYKVGPPVTITAKTGPGLRIKSIATNDGISTAARSFEYKIEGSTSISSGFLSVFPAFYATLQSFAGNMQGLCLTSEPINDIGDGAPIGYSRVTERFQDNSSIVHNYTTYADVPDETMPFLNGYSNSLLAHMSSNNFQRGLETNTRYYDATGVLQKEIDNSYSILPESVEDVQTIELKPTVAIIAAPGDGVNNVNATLTSLYYVHSCFLYNNSKTETTYDKNGHGITTFTNKSYDNVKHLQPTRIETNTSDGGVVTTATSFPDDYPSGVPFIDYMQANHLTSFPIEQVVYKQKGGDNNIVSGNIITYKTEGAGLPEQLLKLETASPISQGSFKFSNRLTGVLPPSSSASQYSPDAHFKPFISYSEYDAKGNLLQQNKVNDQQHAYVWDYKGTYPIAEAVNATQAEIAYTSFEAEGSGGWTIGSGSRDTLHAITGSRSYILNSDISRTGLSSSKAYIISYWSNNSSNSYSVAGSLSGFPVKGKTIIINGNSWTFYMHKITGQTSITISGSGHIDELRLYPAGAQMTTYTFSPLVGMTSQCDVNNRVTYYEYDGFQRLKRIRDQDYYILKTYEYQYQVASGCGSNCFIVSMQTLSGSNTLSYPVGVFNANGKLLDTAANQAAYISLWNADTANSNRGTLAAGADPMHFQITLNTGKTLPSITGCRYYRYDLPWNNLDAVRNNNAAYVDFGDGTGMKLEKMLVDTPAVLAPNTTYHGGHYNDYIHNNDDGVKQIATAMLYLIHSYPDTSTKTLTFYHNDDVGICGFDNANHPAAGLTRLRNFRGNIPQQINEYRVSSYQQTSALTVSQISNWNSIHSIQHFELNNGDGINLVQNVGYAQDFMQYNKGLQEIEISETSDTTFKISRLKSDWNTYFTDLTRIELNDYQWDREDLSALKNLWFIKFSLTKPGGNAVLDTIVNQMAAGAGQNVSRGVINIVYPGYVRTMASNDAADLLKSKHWVISINGVLEQ